MDTGQLEDEKRKYKKEKRTQEGEYEWDTEKGKSTKVM